MVSHGTLVCFALFWSTLSATAVSGAAVDLLVQAADDVQGTRNLLGCEQPEATPLLVVQPATNINGQGNLGDGINQNNQNANTGNQGDVAQGNDNTGVTIGRKLLSCQQRPKPKVKPIVVKPATNFNAQGNGGSGINQNNQNANTGNSGETYQGNSNDGVTIGRKLLTSCDQQPKATPLLVVKPATNVNAQGNGGDGINQNNQNANTGNQGETYQGNSNDGVSIGGRKLMTSCDQQPKATPLVVLNPATNVNAQGNGGDGVNQNNQNANTGNQADTDQGNGNDGVSIGGRKLLTSCDQQPKATPLVVLKPATNVNGQFNGGDGINQNNQNANTGNQGDVEQGNGNQGVAIGGRKLQGCSQQPRIKPIVLKPATNINAQGNGGNGINQNNQNANTGNQGDVAQGNSNEGVTIGFDLNP